MTPCFADQPAGPANGEKQTVPRTLNGVVTMNLDEIRTMRQTGRAKVEDLVGRNPAVKCARKKTRCSMT